MPKKAHGIAPRLVLFDEPAQFDPGTRDQMFSAIKTSLGKIKGSRMISLGTQSSDGSHWFQSMLNKVGCRYSTLYAAPKDADIFSRKTWNKANPSLKYMPELLKQIREEAKDCKKDATLIPQFRALRLNQGVSDTMRLPLLDADTWAAMETEEPVCEGLCVWGIDLSAGSAFSSISAYYPQTGGLKTVAAFGDNPSLLERGTHDSVGPLYEKMFVRGEIILTPGRSIDVPMLIREALDRFGPPDCVVADRFKQNDLIDALESSGIPPCPTIFRGMGFKDGAEDVRHFRRACLLDRVTPEISLLMRSAMAEAVVISDPAGNEKLCKGSEGSRRQNARDDAVASSILAVAAGARKIGLFEEKQEEDSLCIGIAKGE